MATKRLLGSSRTIVSDASNICYTDILGEYNLMLLVVAVIDDGQGRGSSTPQGYRTGWSVIREGGKGILS